MKIYKLSENHIYEPLADKIEKLYIKMGSPTEIIAGKPDTTTGNYHSPHWDPDNIGDWDGDEDAVCDTLNSALKDIQSPLGLDGVPHYYTTYDWDGFVEAASEIISQYHRENWVELADMASDL